MKLPKHMSMSIYHNPHKNYYEKVQDYLNDHLNDYENFKDYITDDDKKICIERDELWELQWYPITPISFFKIYSYSLERCLELAEGDKYDN